MGRALGETMAVIMVAGNQAVLPSGLMSGVRTLTTNIVLEMGYAADLHREALIATAVVLFVFILLINLAFSCSETRHASETGRVRTRHMTQIQTCDVSAAREQSSLRARFDPVSFSLRALVWLAALTVVVVFMWLVGYIVIKGLPYLSPRLFEWEYSTENVSMLPAIVITVLMVVHALLFAAPVRHGGGYLPCGIRAGREAALFPWCG